MTTLASIRARLKEQEARSDRSGSQSNDTNYPFWNIPADSTAVVRFLPDANDNNDFFWTERQMFKLPFSGIVGDPDSKSTLIQVPCMEMYGEKCAILNEVRAWFKDKSLEDMARKYWKKRSYVFQGFVVTDPLKEEEPPENPIRKFVIGPQVFKVIKASLMDPDMDELPTDYTHGLDFRIIKSDSGSGHADYSTSNWARRERALSDEEMSAINQYGLFNLQESLPNRPGEVEQRIMFEMFEASVNGEAYDLERWGQYFRPFGVSAPTGTSDDSVTPRQTPASTRTHVTPPTEEDEPPFETKPTEAPSGENRAEDILAMIRSRQQA